jgi:hypothetical protein
MKYIFFAKIPCLPLRPEWRNWQTRRIQNPVPVKGVWVRVPSSVFEE